MPAFTFEKIAPPTDRGSVQPTAKSTTNKSNTYEISTSKTSTNESDANKQRKLIAQILDCFAEARVRKSLRAERRVIARNKSKTSD